MITKKRNGNKSRKPSKRTNHRAASSVKTGNRSTGARQKSSKSNGGNKSTNNNNLGKRLKIPPENEPFVWLMLAQGRSLQVTADAYTEQFEVKVSKSGIQKHRDTNRVAYDKFREDWYADVKAEPIANSRARVVELWDMAEKLKVDIVKILNYEPREWQDLSVTSLMAEFRHFLDQIRDEAGDKSKAGDIPTQPIQNYFGDVTINALADKTLEARRKEVPDSGNRLKAGGFLDSGNSISSS